MNRASPNIEHHRQHRCSDFSAGGYVTGWCVISLSDVRCKWLHLLLSLSLVLDTATNHRVWLCVYFVCCQLTWWEYTYRSSSRSGSAHISPTTLLGGTEFTQLRYIRRKWNVTECHLDVNPPGALWVLEVPPVHLNQEVPVSEGGRDSPKTQWYFFAF